MTRLETVLLGIVQGLTEFLPISSSGHLVIFQNCLGFKEPEILFDGALHLGTLLAVCLYFRNEIKQITIEIGRRNLTGPNASIAWGVLIGTLPTGFMALTFWLVGRKVRRLGAEKNLVTPSESVLHLYGSRVLAVIFALVLIIFTIPYIAIQPISGGKIFNTL